MNTRKKAQQQSEVNYHGIRVWSVNPVVIPHLETLLITPKFQKWVSDFQFRLVSLQITDIDMFGENVGFYKGKAEAYDEDGELMLSSIFFNRGPFVAILPIITTIIDGEEQELIGLVGQDRVPLGQHEWALPAGMLDEVTGEFKGPIIKKLIQEISEEIPFEGITTNDERIKELSRITPSAGGSDEVGYLYYMKIRISEREYLKLSSGTYGNRKEGEKIRVRFFPYKNFRSIAATFTDAKLFSALYLYESRMKAEEFDICVFQMTMVLAFMGFALLFTLVVYLF
jgi:hypothetical protein